jgi:very-short-patch-repair endonuclease
MRKNATSEERLLWSRLRKKQLCGVKFRRQHILKPYIVDFYAASEKIVVEIDGEQHRFAQHAQADERRDEHLRESYNVEIVRVSAAAVRQNIDLVLEAIEDKLNLEPPPTPTQADAEKQN